MKHLSPRNQLIACLLLAGIGLALFFGGQYRDMGLPLGWVGTLLFVVAVWFCVDAVYRVPHSEGEARPSSPMANGRRGSGWSSSAR